MMSFGNGAQQRDKGQEGTAFLRIGSRDSVHLLRRRGPRRTARRGQSVQRR
jgi:hypothetical protein